MYSSEFPTQTCPYQFTASPAGTEIHKLLYPAFITGFFKPLIESNGEKAHTGRIWNLFRNGGRKR